MATNTEKRVRAQDLEAGDEVMFRVPPKWPTTNVIYNGWYKIEGFVADARGPRRHVCLAGVPGCWPVSRLGWVRKAS